MAIAHPLTRLDGEHVELVTLESGALRVQLSALGARLVTLYLPDRDGKVENVILGSPSLDAYRASKTYFGATIGRFANRIANGHFELDGESFQLGRNAGRNNIHGGPIGFDKHVWEVVERDGSQVRFRIVSPDGDQGFPGELTLEVTFTLADGALRLDYDATTTKPTVHNFTNHTYFDLDGGGSADVERTELQIFADHYLPCTADSVPLGELASVEGTPLDFRTTTPIGDRIRVATEQIIRMHGLDFNWVLPATTPGKLVTAARVRGPRSGRTIACETDQPGLQIYTGNNLDGGDRSHDGSRVYRQGDGFTLETQRFPNAPNTPGFPSCVLRPGERFNASTIFRFGVR